jgi:hypothetical protein
VTVGLAGTVNVAGKTSVIVSPVVSAPLALEVKLTAQLDRAPPVWGVPVNVGAVVDVAALIVIEEAGFAAVESELVLTLQLDAAIEPAAGFVRNLIERFPDADAASAHVPALSESVIVTVVPEPEPAAEQFV